MVAIVLWQCTPFGGRVGSQSTTIEWIVLTKKHSTGKEKLPVHFMQCLQRILTQIASFQIVVWSFLPAVREWFDGHRFVTCFWIRGPSWVPSTGKHQWLCVQVTRGDMLI